MTSLTLTDARIRTDLISVERYTVRLDLTQGAETFGSHTQIRFGSTTPGATVLLDVQPETLTAVRLNGVSLDVAGLRDGRYALPDLREDNLVEVEATMAYGRDGNGLHRAVDPADDEAYVYGMAFLDAAPRIFACFDQPDLKAPYDVAVRAPEGWSVFANGVPEGTDDDGFVRFATTPPLATYFVTVCAGPWTTVRDDHDGIPLSLSARASQQQQLEAQAPQMLEITKQSFDYFHELFGERYPFGDYDQVFVPDFNAGAMENPGCVVHNDSMLFTGGASRGQLLGRSNTIAHEMAHMWFGNLVTMRWWDDLWLNESFAEYMSHRALVEATEFTDAFVDFGVGGKLISYRADRAPSTHPIAGVPALDAEAALQNFDGISYGKGASVLRQLIAHVGDDAFVEGVRDHLSSHRFGNAELADFLDAMGRAAGRDLGAWQQVWLRTPGADRIEVSLEADDQVVRTARLTRTAPEDFPADRPHTLDVAGYRDGVRVLQADVEISADEQEVSSLVGQPVPDVLIPNAADLTWAEVVLDSRTLALLPERLRHVPDDSARAVVWASLSSGLARGTVDPRLVVRTFRAALPHEPSEPVLDVASLLLPTLILSTRARSVPAMAFLPEVEQPWASEQFAATGLEILDAGADSSRAITAARLVAATSPDTDLLQRWLRGDGLPDALTDDLDLRWRIAHGLARHGALGDADLTRLADDDRTMSGHLNVLRARTLRPTAEAKARAWELLTRDASLSNYEQKAYAESFWDGAPLDLVEEYVPRYFVDIPALADRVQGFALQAIAMLGFPGIVVAPDTLERSEQALARDDLAAAVRRAITDRSHDVRCALASRQAHPGGAA